MSWKFKKFHYEDGEFIGCVTECSGSRIELEFTNLGVNDTYSMNDGYAKRKLKSFLEAFGEFVSPKCNIQSLEERAKAYYNKPVIIICQTHISKSDVQLFKPVNGEH